MPIADEETQAPWLMFIFKLPVKQASGRVEIWRKLKRYGALAMPTSGYVLPNTLANQERFEWLAAAIRKYKGQASVVQALSIGDLPARKLTQLFTEARSRDYEVILKELRNPKRPSHQLSRIRKRFQEIVEIDFFNSPLRSRVEALLARVDETNKVSDTDNQQLRTTKKYLNRTWITRQRPGIDRVSSAWLIRRFIDPNAKFAFGVNSQRQPNAIPFDMFGPQGFGHRGDDCTFETLRKRFGIRDHRVATIAEIIHDADLADEKFGRVEGIGLDRVLIGWAEQGMPDEELLRRGIELIEGLYQSISGAGRKQ
jgi:hypothetical protein